MCVFMPKYNIPPPSTQDGWTGLIVAAEHGHFGVVQHLLDKGADINTASKVPGRPGRRGRIAEQRGQGLRAFARGVPSCRRAL